jgi:hypothetical protein
MSTNDTPSLVKLARQINAEHAAIIDHTQTSLQRAMAAGAMLKEVKDKVGHGAWEKWLKANCPDISKETATLYMRLHKNTSTLEAEAEANQQRITDLSIRGAAKIISRPRPEGEAKAKRAKGKATPEFGSWALDEVLIALKAAFDTEELNELAKKLAELAKPREAAPAPRPPTPPLPQAGIDLAHRSNTPMPPARQPA